MHGYEPEMSLSRLQNRIDFRISVEPVEECPHFFVETRGWRRLKMHMLFPDGARDNLHRTGAVFTPCAYAKLVQAAAAGGKERRVPPQKTFLGVGVFLFLGGGGGRVS